MLYRWPRRSPQEYDAFAGLVRDAHGNLYGATQYGGNFHCGGITGCGTIFKFDSAGRLTVLHTFTAGADGAFPRYRMILDAHGNLYGTTVGSNFPLMSATYSKSRRSLAHPFLINPRASGWYRICALRGNPATPAGTLAEVNSRPVLDGYSACECRGTAESARNTTDVAIRVACDRWRSERAALAATLHPARNRAEEDAGAACPELGVDWSGGSSGSRVRCGSGARNNLAPVAGKVQSSCLFDPLQA